MSGESREQTAEEKKAERERIMQEVNFSFYWWRIQVERCWFCCRGLEMNLVNPIVNFPNRWGRRRCWSWWPRGRGQRWRLAPVRRSTGRRRRWGQRRFGQGMRWGKGLISKITIDIDTIPLIWYANIDINRSLLCHIEKPGEAAGRAGEVRPAREKARVKGASSCFQFYCLLWSNIILPTVFNFKY